MKVLPNTKPTSKANRKYLTRGNFKKEVNNTLLLSAALESASMIGLGGISIAPEISAVASLCTPQPVIRKTQGNLNLSWSCEDEGCVEISPTSSIPESSLVGHVYPTEHCSSTHTTASILLITFPDNPSLTEPASFILCIKIQGEIVTPPTPKWRNEDTYNPCVVLYDGKSFDTLDCLPISTSGIERSGLAEINWMKMSQKKIILPYIRHKA